MARNPKITPEHRDSWVERYNQGVPSTTISEEAGVSKRTVLTHLKSVGVKLRPPRAPQVYVGDRKSRLRQCRYMYKYGITLDQYNAMLIEQSGLCAICGSFPSGKGTNNQILHIDHDHETEKTRQLLCGRCNVSIGLVDESPDIVGSMIEYVGRHKL